MAKLITMPARVRRTSRRRRAGSRLARIWADARGRIDTENPQAKVAALLVAGGLGALAQYLFIGGRRAARRRHTARDRAGAALRRGGRAAVHRTKYLEGVGAGVAHKAAHALPGVGAHKEQPDDVTLAQKVESIAFRKAHVPKEHVNVNAENGIVYLRGWLEREDEIAALVRMAAAVEGVQRVENLLHAHSSGDGPAS
jgi:hypothetical protein